jgi:hypothetical protein
MNVIREKKQGRGSFLVLVVLAALWLLPTVGLFITSLRAKGEAQTSGWWDVIFNPFSQDWDLSSYTTVLTENKLASSFISSMAVTIPATILAGDRETGVSTIVMDQGVDTGPIIAVQHLRTRPAVTAAELEVELAELAALGIADTLATWLQGSEAAVPQGVDGATQTKRLSRVDGRIGAQTPFELALRMWRAYQPWPGVWVEIPGVADRLILSGVSAAEGGAPVSPGALELRNDTLLLGLAGGTVRLNRVTPAGGKSMTGGEFARGRQGELAARGRIAE